MCSFDSPTSALKHLKTVFDDILNGKPRAVSASSYRLLQRRRSNYVEACARLRSFQRLGEEASGLGPGESQFEPSKEDGCLFRKGHCSYEISMEFDSTGFHEEQTDKEQYF